MLASFAAAFAFRWLTLSEFFNDHFDHVSLAQQLLLGALPVRDFTDEGLFLTYGITAAAWALFKAPFFSEAVVVGTGFAIAAALSFRVAALASRSIAIATLVVVAQIALYPRSYSYQKLLVQAVAITVAWWAAERLTSRRVAALAGVTALGYYFRHDHAVYLGAAIGTLVYVRQAAGGMRLVTRTLLTYGGLTLLFVLPHVAYVQWAAGAPTYFAIAREYVRAEAGGGRYTLPLPSLDLRAGLWQWPDAPLVNVRWVTALDDAARKEREGRYHLGVVDHVEGTTWRYRVTNASGGNVRALRADRAVEDTHGFEQLEAGEQWGRLLTETRPGPGWRFRENSLALLFWLCWIIPPAAICMLFARAVAKGGGDEIDAARVAMLAVLAASASAGYLRAPLTVRLPDVAVPYTVLTAWMLGMVWRWPATSWRRAGIRLSTAVAAVVVIAAITVLYGTPALLRESRLADGPGAAAQRFRDVAHRLRTGRPGPIPSNPSAILLPFVDYLQACTTRDDRLLYAWYSPEVYIVAGRAFAGDHRKFLAPFHSSSWEQARTVARLKQQRVPFVIIPSERQTSFETTYSDVWRYVQQRYVPMTRIRFDERSTFDIFRDATWTSDRVYGSTGWPCPGARTSPRS